MIPENCEMIFEQHQQNMADSMQMQRRQYMQIESRNREDREEEDLDMEELDVLPGCSSANYHLTEVTPNQQHLKVDADDTARRPSANGSTTTDSPVETQTSSNNNLALHKASHQKEKRRHR
jgi:hypothetical protein